MKNKEKLLLNLLVFLASLLLIMGFLKQDIMYSFLALVFAVGAQIIFRKRHPKKFYSYKDVMKQKQTELYLKTNDKG